MCSGHAENVVDRLAQVLIGVAMVVIAGSTTATLYLVGGFSTLEAGSIGTAALLAMLVVALLRSQKSERDSTLVRIDDLAHADAKLIRELTQLHSRVVDLESRVGEITDRPSDARLEMIDDRMDTLESVSRELAEAVTTLSEVRALQPRPARVAAPAAEPMPADAPAVAVEETPPTPERPAPPRPERSAAFADLSDHALGQLAADAVEAGRIEVFLQPIVTLPQRRVRYYEAAPRLRTVDGDLMAPVDFRDVGAMRGLNAKVDLELVRQSANVVRRLTSRSREVGVFIDLSLGVVGEDEVAAEIQADLEKDQALGGSIVLGIRQRDLAMLGPLEMTAIDHVADFGYRFSLQDVTSLDVDPAALAAQKIRHVQFPASLLIGGSGLNTDIHPADFSDLFARHGISIVATGIEREAEVVDLLDFNIGLAQGNLFSPARPLRADIAQIAKSATPQEPARTPPSREIAAL